MDIQTGIRWMELFNEKIQQEKDYLTQLDTPIGDSDHGNNMSRGMTYVVEAIDTQSPDSLEALLKIVTAIFTKQGRGCVRSTIWFSIYGYVENISRR